MTIEQSPRKQGRDVVVSSEIIPGTNGRARIFHTEFDPEANPVSPELEEIILKSASSEAMREIFVDMIAETRGES